jgi:ABC-type multidrug transport system ATPase subunit
MGVLFFALLFLTLGAMAELPSAIMSRAVFYKQYYQGFYPATAKLLAETAVASMETALEVVAFVPAVYFLVGFDYTASSFLTFLVILIGLNLAMTSIFKMFAALLPSFDTAQSIAGLVLILLVLFCGFLIQENSIPDVLIFIYWLNPLAWAFRAVAVNEFRSPSYDVCSVPNVPAGQPCPSGLTLSEQIFLTYDLRSDVSWIWTGLAFVYIFWFVMTVLTGVVLSNVRYHGANGEITEDDVKDEQGWVHETEDVAGGELGGGLPAPAPGAVSDVEASTLAAPEPATQCPTHMSSVCSQYHTSATADRESILATTESMDLDTPQFVPVTLTFEHINYSVPHPGGDGMLELLHDITGYAKPGTMTCLMGSSGAGKTTLLDVLAGRKTGGEITGSIKLNGHVKEAKSFARIAGYIEQFDAHSPAVTVEEAVQFSALMRLEESEWSPESRAAYVENILRMLELTPIASCVIGSDMAGGISMEQRKRTTIAVEMAANPSLLFLDEPTTGLDARSAQVVMRAVRMVAETQRTIICTIHQPSTYLFEMFDALLLLKKGGQTVFFGDLGPCSQSMISYFMSVPGCKPIADNGNAATWALEQIGAGTSSKVNPQTFADFYAISPLKDQHRQALVELTTPKQGSQPISFPHLYAASSATQYKGNLSRAFMQYWRSPNYNFSRMFLAVVQAIFLSCSYVGKDIETVGDAISIIGVM